MKKFFTFAAILLSSLSIQAKDYKGDIKVTVANSLTTTYDQAITVDKQNDGKYTLKLKNFSYGTMQVGTIVITDINATAIGDINVLTFNGKVKIQANEDGTGALKGQDVTINLNAKQAGNIFATKMNIKYIVLNIDVDFTSGSQIPGSDFENSHVEQGMTTKLKEGTEDEYENVKFDINEPNHWHSFGSAIGDLASVVKMNKQSDVSTDVRPGSKGKQSAKVMSALEFGAVPANGTLTTGRLQAGGYTPKDTKNCAFIDLSKNDVDSHGDPFYTTLNASPDSIKLWVKFKQGTLENPENKYASVNAVITDGTYYQDPEDKVYSNVFAKATNTKIESKNFVWQEITIPFVYIKKEEDLSPKAVLVTISTNSVPGAASTDAANPDELYIDDLSLVYNTGLKTVKFKGKDIKILDGKGSVTVDGKCSEEDFEFITNGVGATCTWSYNTEGNKLYITVISSDLVSEDNYTLNLIGGTITGINNSGIKLPANIKAIYNLAGQKVDSMQSGQVYIVKYTNGETKKMVKK